MSYRLKVRPFEKITDAHQGTKEHIISGAIENGSFWLGFDQARYPIPTREIGSDGLGPFAIIDECDTELRGGDNFRVEAEFEEPLGNVLLPPRCHICIIVKENWNPDLIENELREAWIDPASVNLLVPLKWSLDVYFFSNGKLENAYA